MAIQQRYTVREGTDTYFARILVQLLRPGQYEVCGIEQPIGTHPDTAVDSGHGDQVPLLPQRPEPGQHMGTVGIDQGAIKIERDGGSGRVTVRPYPRPGRITQMVGTFPRLWKHPV
ncbi:hypothetical protein [Frankia gtarii]|uniref:hypothetical protein n=1 Tax=Frankia gtarii TaxID=2950102 RepID=UPI0021BFB1E2|nr:hypothetical protein [Frankia gtarii]